MNLLLCVLPLRRQEKGNSKKDSECLVNREWHRANLLQMTSKYVDGEIFLENWVWTLNVCVLNKYFFKMNKSFFGKKIHRVHGYMRSTLSLCQNLQQNLISLSLLVLGKPVCFLLPFRGIKYWRSEYIYMQLFCCNFMLPSDVQGLKGGNMTVWKRLSYPSGNSLVSLQEGSLTPQNIS